MPRKPSTRPSRPRIVWAEDSGIDQFLIQSVLHASHPHLRVEFATDGNKALDLVRKNRPTLLVLDVRMAGLGGIETLRRVRADASVGHVPVVLFSSLATPEDQETARQLGVSSILQKPVDYDAFSAAVARIARIALNEKPLVAVQSVRRPVAGGALHDALFWDSDEQLQQHATSFLRGAADQGRGLIVLATGPHLRMLRAALPRVEAQWLDTAATLSAITRDGRPDAHAFAVLFAQAVAEASQGGTRPVACFGEIVDVLRAQGHFDAAVAIEAIWQQAAGRDGPRLSILCANSATVMADVGAFGVICAQHATRILPSRVAVVPARA